MNKQFQRFPEFLSYQPGQCIDFTVSFMHIEIPGNGEVTVDMQHTAILYHPQVVQVHPVLFPVGVQHLHQPVQQLLASGDQRGENAADALVVDGTKERRLPGLRARDPRGQDQGDRRGLSA